MDISCQIIQDLIPLYVEGGCSPETEAAVHTHVSCCRECAAVFCCVYDERYDPDTERVIRGPGRLARWCRDNARKLFKGFWILTAVCLLLVCGAWSWWELTEVDRVRVTPEDYRVVQALQMADGDIYCEIESRYRSTFTHHYVLRDDQVYFLALRPVLDQTGCTKSGWRLDPESVWDREAEEYRTVDAVYLGNPEDPDNTVLIWKRGMELPLATAEETVRIEGQDWTIY